MQTDFKKNRVGLRVILLAIMAILASMPGCLDTKLSHPNTDSPVVSMSASVMKLYQEAAQYAKSGEVQKSLDKYLAALEEAFRLQDEYGIGYCLFDLGLLYFSGFKDYLKALEYFSLATIHFKNANNLQAEAKAFLLIAEIHIGKGEGQSAIEALDKALLVARTIFQQISPDEAEKAVELRGRLYWWKAQAHRALKQFKESVENYRLAASDFFEIGKNDAAAYALLQAGDVLRVNMASPAKAIDDYDRACSLLEKLGEPEGSGWARLNLAWSLFNLGDYDNAFTAARKVIDIATQERLTDLLVNGLLCMGSIYEAQNQLDDSISLLDAALQQLRKGDFHNDQLKARLLLASGNLSNITGRYDDAAENLQAAAVLFREIGLPEDEASAYKELADSLTGLGDNKKASQYYQRALSLYTMSGNVFMQIEATVALASMLSLMGSSYESEGVKYFQESWRLFNSYNDKIDLHPADILAKVHEATEAERKILNDKFLRSARENIPSVRSEWIIPGAEILSLIESSSLRFQEWQKMAPSLGRAYLKAAGALFRAHGALGIRLGDFNKAISDLGAAYLYHSVLPFDRDVGVHLLNDFYCLGAAYRLKGELQKAVMSFHLAESLANLVQTSAVGWVYGALARTYRDLHDAHNALFYYRNAVSTFTSVSNRQNVAETKIQFMEMALPLYNAFADFLLEHYTDMSKTYLLKDAFECTQGGKAQVFLDMLQRSAQRHKSGVTDSLPSQTETLRFQMEKLHSKLRASKPGSWHEKLMIDQLDQFRKSSQEFRKDIIQDDPRALDMTLAQPAGIQEVQSYLDDDTIFFEYSTATDRSILWAITRDQVEFFFLPGRDKLPILEKFLDTLRGPLIGNEEIANHVALGKELYELAIHPAERLLRNKRHIIIAPDGPLHYLPFEALIMPKSDDQKTKNGSRAAIPYLITKYEVSYVPSASVFLMQCKGRIYRKRSPLPLLAFGDPTYGEFLPASDDNIESQVINNVVLRDHSLSRLIFSGEEVRRIASIWGLPLDSEHIFLRERATAMRLRELDLSQYRIIHFATHAVLADEVRQVTQPAIVLSRVDQEADAGLLEFSDILNLKLNAELVTLSACNTGLGDLRLGEGMIGLTRAFIYAGSSSVLVSLWKVEDQSTSFLMESFYRHLKHGKTKIEALRHAKLEVINAKVKLKAVGTHQKLASPFYWAAFILVGETQ